MRLVNLALFSASLLGSGCHRTPQNAGAAPLSAQGLPAASCGGLETLGRAAAPMDLLDGRLTVTPLAGTELLPRSGPLMGASTPPEKETRLFLEQGAQKMVIMAYELERLAGDDFLTTAPAWFQPSPGTPGPAWKTLTLPPSAQGLQVVLGWAETPLDLQGEAVPALMGLARHPDGTAQLIIFYVTPEESAAGGLGCTALALGLAQGLEAGPRALDRAGGPRQLTQLDEARALQLTLPDDVLLSEQRGPDFSVFLAQPLRPISAGAAVMGVYVGGHPEAIPEGQPLPGALLGQDVTWTTWTDASAGNLGVSRQELILPLPTEGGAPLMMHVFLSADQPEDLPALQQIAETLSIGAPLQRD